MQGPPITHGIFKIFTQGHLKGFPQDLYKIFSQGLRQGQKISPGSSQDLLTRTYTRPWSRSSYKDLLRVHYDSLPRSLRIGYQHHATTRAGPRGTKWWEGCTSDIKMSTSSQRKRSDMQEVSRGLRGPYQNERHKDSHVTRAKWRKGCVGFHKVVRAQQNRKIKNYKVDVLPGFWILFHWGVQNPAPAKKNEPDASKVLPLPCRSKN